jgi:hypothetical protein
MEVRYYNNQPNFRQILIKASLIIAGAIVLDNLFDESMDRANYTLYYKGGKVYHGISYEDCFNERINQHERAGIIRFGDCVYDYPKTRTAALALEGKRITRDQTPYNTHHR